MTAPATDSSLGCFIARRLSAESRSASRCGAPQPAAPAQGNLQLVGVRRKPLILGPRSRTGSSPRPPRRCGRSPARPRRPWTRSSRCSPTACRSSRCCRSARPPRPSATPPRTRRQAAAQRSRNPQGPTVSMLLRQTLALRIGDEHSTPRIRLTLARHSVDCVG